MPGVLLPAGQAGIRLAPPVWRPSRRLLVANWLRLLAASVIVLSVLLPQQPRMMVALACIILLGVPHGALDGELARTVLRPRFGWLWFPVFSLPYLMLSATVLAAWSWVPAIVLGVFLAASMLHFGAEETGSADPVAIIAAGGAPIALTVLSHPAATAAILGTVAGLPLTSPPVWLGMAALLWTIPAAMQAIRLARSGQTGRLVLWSAVGTASMLLPPLTAFALYFVCVHAPAHVDGLIRDRRMAPRIVDGWSAAKLSAGVTLLTLLIGAMLWPLYHGPALPRLLCLTIQGLAALTLPHMLFESWLRHRSA